MLRDAPTVSVLTIHHGSNETLNRLKCALEQQSYPADRFNWVIVDDCSPVEAPAWFERPDAKFMINGVRLTENIGRAKARNRALEEATGELIAFIDSDMEPVSVWLEMLVRGVQRSKGVIAGRFDPALELNRNAFQRYAHSRGAHKYAPGERIPGRYFTSGNCAFPRFFADHAGGFDDSFKGWGGEDLEFAVQLEKAGAVFHYEPRARTFHDHQITWHQQAQRYLEFGENAIPKLLAKHPDLEEKLSLSSLKFSSFLGLRDGLLRPLLLRTVCNRLVFHLVQRFVTAFPDFCWPARVFDYMVFYLYSRAYARSL